MSVEDFFELSLDNACIAGFDGYFKRVNPSWTRTLGWTEQELMARPTLEFVHPDDRAATLAGRERLRAGAELGPLVNRYLCKDGSYRWFEWRSVAEVGRGLVFGLARDVTEHKLAEHSLREANASRQKLEQQLILAGRMASVGTLAAGVAHEINNPLAQVSGNLAMALEDLETVGEPATGAQVNDLKELLREAQGGAERIRKIVRGLQTFAHAEDERRSWVELQPLLELCISMIDNELRHRARLVTRFGTTPVIEADEGRLGQVFVNLLLNAAQAMRETEQATSEITIVTSTDGTGRAVVEIHDTGHGIPASIIDRIFEPFFTTKPLSVGTGLGLSICHNVVTTLGGQITVTSELGTGTTFRVVLPPADARSRPPVPYPGSDASERALGRATVLIVDDEPAIGLLLCRILRDHDVTAVTSVKDALGLLESGKSFDVVLSDLMMPHMSGMDLYAELGQRFPALVSRVVFVTGGAFTASAREFLERIPNPRLRKPFDPSGVRKLVERIASE